MSDRCHFSPAELRELMRNALPEDTSLHGGPPSPRHVYLPAAHAKALHPDRMLVVGIRGSGKSFWWAALQQENLRAAIGRQVGLGEETLVSTGFGEKTPSVHYPGKDVISSLVEQFDPRHLWQAVVLRQVGGDRLPPEFASLSDWSERVPWVQSHPEAVERCLYDTDQALEQEGRHHLVLFDALERTASDWKTMNPLVRALLQLMLDFRSCQRLRLKVFARPDQIEDPVVTAFPDASKVLSGQTELHWPRHELYGLLWQYLANEPMAGHVFRDGCPAHLAVSWAEDRGVWRIPTVLCNDEDAQRTLFHAMTGPWMGTDRRRGFPYTWLPNHLGDARQQVSPRSFLAALRCAAEDTPRPDQQYALHYESIKRGVQEASRIRVIEIREDYPWIDELLKSLAGMSVPCPFEDIKRVWEEKNALKSLATAAAAEGVRLPPAHLGDGPEGVFQDLEGLGLFSRNSRGLVNLPDVYRVGYGLGRRGGVRPVR